MMSAAFIPRAPRTFVAADNHLAFRNQMSSLERELSAQRVERDTAFTRAREAQNAALLSLNRRHAGDVLGASAKLSEAMTILQEVLQARSSQTEDDNFLSAAAQQVCTVQVFESFLTTGTLGARPTFSSSWAPVAPVPKRQVGSKSPRAPDAGDDDDDDDDNAGDATGSGGGGAASAGTGGRGGGGGPTDEEWLGALISSAHEIGRYANGAATCGDVRSVHAARDVVTALHDALAAFDLRNGGLRRSFDSLKYVVRRLEDIVYELSLFPPPDAAEASIAAGESGVRATSRGASAGASGGDEVTTPSPPCLLDTEALDAAREAYAALDTAREGVIKRCREPQKLAKQAISALHRGDASGSKKALVSARKGAIEVLTTDLRAHPSLRSQGTVRAMLEELAEASLFEAWLLGDGSAASAAAGGVGGGNGGVGGGGGGGGGGPILLPGDPCLLGDGVLQPSEYLGGVCDLVGEIGRHAVRKATERDADAVRASLATAVAVQSALLSLGPAAPRGLHKKGDGLRTSVRKMETLLYELSLVERSGRVREAPAEVPDAPPPEGGAGGDED